MDDLREFYNSIENPIDNKYKWNSLLNLYCSSYDFNDFYEKVTYINKSTNPYYMNDDKENFSLLMYLRRVLYLYQKIKLNIIYLREYLTLKYMILFLI
jgi:hypothetical protein